MLATSRVLREFTVATEVTPLALHWTMCMAAELHQSMYPESDWFNNCFKCKLNARLVGGSGGRETPTQLSPRDCLPPGLASPRVIPGNLSCSVISISTPHSPLTPPSQVTKTGASQVAQAPGWAPGSGPLVLVAAGPSSTDSRCRPSRSRGDNTCCCCISQHSQSRDNDNTVTVTMTTHTTHKHTHAQTQTHTHTSYNTQTHAHTHMQRGQLLLHIRTQSVP